MGNLAISYLTVKGVHNSNHIYKARNFPLGPFPSKLIGEVTFFSVKRAYQRIISGFPVVETIKLLFIPHTIVGNSRIVLEKISNINLYDNSGKLQGKLQEQL